MRACARAFAAISMGATVAACGIFPERKGIRDERQGAEISRAVAESAQRVSVSKTGAKVCRQIRIGIAELDWVRGTVTQVEPGKVRVHIDEPGRSTHVLDGITLTRGTLIWDAPVNWTPCR